MRKKIAFAFILTLTMGFLCFPISETKAQIISIDLASSSSNSHRLYCETITKGTYTNFPTKLVLEKDNELYRMKYSCDKMDSETFWVMIITPKGKEKFVLKMEVEKAKYILELGGKESYLLKIHASNQSEINFINNDVIIK